MGLLPRLAVVDDEPGIRTLLEIELGNDFDVRSAPDATSGVELVRAWQPDAIVLDVMLPDLDGIALIPTLRWTTQAPIVMLSAKDTTHDRVSSLTNGADLYIRKPVEIPELIAMLRSALRRPSLAKPQHLQFGDLSIDLHARVVERNGTAIHITGREFDLLATLAREPHRVFTRNELLDRIWGDKVVTFGVVDTYISLLRAKIDEPFVQPLIHTIRGVGFSMRAGQST
jgi:DNA-binding response OmpR family regulator